MFWCSVWLLVALLLPRSADSDAIFTRCDLDHNNKWHVKEFVQCFQAAIKSEDNRDQMELLFHHLDLNKDGYLTADEYNKAQQTFKSASTGRSDKDFVTVTDRHGKQRDVKLDSVLKTMEENLKGFQRVGDNQLMKEEEKTSSVRDLDPQTALAVNAGNWSFHTLQTLGYYQGLLRNLQQVEMHPKSRMPVGVAVKHLSNRATWINMTLQVEASENKYQAFSVNVQVIHDPISFEAPYFHMLRAVATWTDGETQHLTPPPARPRSWSRILSFLLHKVWMFWKSVFYRLVGMFSGNGKLGEL